MNIESPLVSIIVPCYNYGHLLHETLESVVAQTYQNWECIIVDDGSTDNTRQVAMNYIDNDSRFLYQYQKNKGLASARNTGFKLAKGYYIQLLDSDDILPPEKIQRHVTILKTRPEVDLVYGRVSIFEKQLSNLSKAKLITLEAAPSSGRGVSVLSSLIEDNMFLVHCVLFRSSIVHDVGFFDERMVTCEDWNFWFRCALSDKYFLFFDDEKSKVFVRSHGSNMSTNQKNMWTGRLFFRKEAARMLDIRGWISSDFELIKKRNIKLLATLNKRFQLAYGNLLVGMTTTMKIIFIYGDRLNTVRDSLYWVKQRLLNKV